MNSKVEKIWKHLEKRMNQKSLNLDEPAIDKEHCYCTGFISALRFFKVISIGESNELSFKLCELYQKRAGIIK